MSLRSFLFSALALTVVLAGCSGSRQMPQSGGVMLGTPKSVSPASISPAPMAHTAILPSSDMSAKPRSAIQGANWTQIPGAASYAAAAPDGSLWVLSTAPSGADKYIWHYVSGTWTNISGLATRLSVAPNGTLYAINSGGGTYSYSGGTWTALGGGASDITAAADGSFYVLSNGNSAGSDQAIWHYTTSWTQVAGSGVRIAASWDPNSFVLSNGTVSPGGLYILNSIGSIYYENANNSFVQLPGNASAIAPTTIGGVFVLGYPTNGSGNVIYYYDLNAQGWSAQSGAGVSISTDGAHLYAIGSSGGIFSTPVKSTSGTIVEYSLSKTGVYPLGITAGPDGNLWFTEFVSSGNKIGKITLSGNITEYPVLTNPAALWGIVTGADGNLWFTEGDAPFPSVNHHIGRIIPSGSSAGMVTEFPIPSGMVVPRGIAPGPDGNLWFAEFDGNSIAAITTAGTITEYATPTAASHPEGIVAGPDGNLWFTENAGNKIGKVTPTTGTFTEYGIPTGNSAPTNIAVGPDNNLWFTELNGGKIGKITTSGTITEYPIVNTGTPQPWGITTGPDGNVWFTESGGNKIGKITTSGTITEYPLPATNSHPSGIVTGADGNLWFTESNLSKIGKITP
jgi:streptogramin lyase